MINIAREPDDYKIITEEADAGDAQVRFTLEDNYLHVYLRAEKTQPKFVMLRWNYRTDEPVRVLGDTWERAYVDLSWQGLSGERFMPWYFLCANNHNEVSGCGVMVQPNSFVSFEYDSFGVTGWFDVRCGARGVCLNGRELEIGVVISKHYVGISSFEAATDFCAAMCPNPVLPEKPVYGGNNWYYAYGVSSGEEVRKDAALIAEFANGCDNRPFMVIDDGWQMSSCTGPWLPNDKFGDMQTIASDFRKMGVRPGIWVRLLHDEQVEREHPEWCLKTKADVNTYLDPSHPEVKQYLRDVIARIKGWGFELLKHDYSTYDIFGAFGFDLNGTITNFEDWCFYDQTKTSAEIVLDFYRLIREVCGSMMVLGCNTVSHMCAGLVEINRVGDDTSGKYWSRTRTLGINSLAFRLPQNKRFYMIDADCVGILNGNIPWELNGQWAELLARSGTPLFVSCEQGGLNGMQKNEMQELFFISSLQEDQAIPLDWEYNNVPHIWNINGSIRKFDWILNSYPALLKNNIQPM